MAELSSSTYQYLTQLGLTRLVDVSAGPDGPHGVVSHFLVGANGWHNGARLPHEVVEDLKGAKLTKQTVEGVDYLLVPEVSSNTPGRLSEYAQRTGVADLVNPPGGGVNASRQHINTAEATVDPEGVAKYVADAPEAHDEARDLRVERNSLVDRAIRAGEGSDDASTSGGATNTSVTSPAKDEVNPA